MFVSVAVCTWNRASLLDRTLQQMRRLQIPAGVGWELLVVNNRCTDETDAVLAAHGNVLPIRRLYEPEAGLSHARNCALNAGRGRLILWTDDDVLVDEQWLASYCRAAGQFPEASFFGGPIRPWFETPPPRWITANLDVLAGVHALRDLGDVSFICDHDTLPFGANFAVRSDALRRYRFDPRLGRVHKDMLSGEETGLLRQMRADGLHGRWIPQAAVRHFVPRERLTRQYTRRFFNGLGRTDVLMQGRTTLPRRTLWKKAVQAEIKYCLHYWISPPEKWLKYLIRSSHFWGQLAADSAATRTSKAA